jgi:hypothetical protein
VALDLSNGSIFWFWALALFVLLFLADVLIGDIYAMQKLLIALVLTWIGYCLVLGMTAQYMMKDLTTTLFPGEMLLGITVNGLMSAPIKIAFIGLIYWMSSMIIRSLSAGRIAAAAAERKRRAVELA